MNLQTCPGRDLISYAGDAIPFLAMEYSEGVVPLNELNPEEIPSQSAQSARAALEAMHKLGVAHCDMRADNMLLFPSGSVMLLDFGHALIQAGSDKMSRDVSDLTEILLGISQPSRQHGGSDSPVRDTPHVAQTSQSHVLTYPSARPRKIYSLKPRGLPGAPSRQSIKVHFGPGRLPKSCFLFV